MAALTKNTQLLADFKKDPEKLICALSGAGSVRLEGNGRTVAYVLSPQAFENLVGQDEDFDESNLEDSESLQRSLEDMDAGRVVSASQVLAELEAMLPCRTKSSFQMRLGAN